MPTKAADASPAADAVDEAIRTVSGVSQRNAEQAKRIVANSNSLMTEQFATGRRLYQAWADGMQAVLKASFEAQNSMFETAPSLLEAAYSANKTMLGTRAPALDAFHTASKTLIDSVPEVMHQYQKAVLGVIQEASTSTEKLLTPPAK